MRTLIEKAWKTNSFKLFLVPENESERSFLADFCEAIQPDPSYTPRFSIIVPDSVSKDGVVDPDKRGFWIGKRVGFV